MREAFSLFFSRVVVYLLLVVAFIGLIISRVRRRLRVSPEQHTHAPAIWLVSMTADARQHRRLRKLAAEARSHARGGKRHADLSNPTPAQLLARDLDREIIQLDDRLARASRADYDTRRAALQQLRVEVDRMVGLVDRVGKLLAIEGTNASAAIPINALDELDARLSRLETLQQAAKVIESDGRAASPQISQSLAGRSVVPAQLTDGASD